MREGIKSTNKRLCEVENLQVSKKGPKDFVTNSDRKAEKILITELSKKFFNNQ